MADTNFVPGTVIASTWLRDANTSVYNILTAVAGTNTVTGNGPSTVTALARGQRFFFTPQNTNTGAATLNVSGLGARPLNKQGSVALIAGDLVAGSTCIVFFDGVQYQVLNPQGPLSGTDTYITTAGTSIAYTLAISGSFSRFVGNAVKLTFNAANTSTTPTLDVGGTGAALIKVLSADGTLINPNVGTFGANTTGTAVWDGTNWVVTPDSVTGRLLNVQTILASGTYTPTPGTTKIIVEGNGAGGAGGGATVTGAGQISLGTGGGAGGYGKTLITSGFFPNVAVVVGIGGVPVGGAAGGSGTISTFGAFMTLNGGGGGFTSPAAAIAAGGGGGGGTTTGASIVSYAGAGGDFAVAAAVTTYVASGKGGDTQFGTGGVGTFIFTGGGAAAAVGNNGLGRGAGGSGAVSASGGGANPGGFGANGIFTVYEYS